jgi:UDP-N-acetylglucosamine--N-acetylmuramyl-(pentapeptide) pyrophosphoryl-undecaprenol N-acetylglucosamine transferase
LIGRLKPKAVVGFGGYPTLPPLFAASRRGVPTLIHEQNAVMGRANKALAGRVTAIAGGFLNPSSSATARTVVTGNPVKGARFFSEAIPHAIALLPDAARKRIRVTQQARAEDEAEVTAAYAKMGVSAEISPFFTDMAERIATAHLVVSRSGASTVSEIAVIGRPALLVPYPHALDHDQAANAAALAAAGGAQVHPQSALSSEGLADIIAGLMNDPGRLKTMAEAARSVGRPDAAALLADLAEAIAEGRSITEISQGTRQ